jgi:hypothetical protein
MGFQALISCRPSIMVSSVTSSSMIHVDDQ